jgi:hypothetical protein
VKRISILVLFAFIVLTSCKEQTNIPATSRVDYFEYQGYGDTIVSLLYGTVVEKESDGKTGLTPLEEVIVTVKGTNTTDSTKADGEFVVGLPDGIYELSIQKPGYQTLVLSNYVSDPDRVSVTKIILVKGSDVQQIKIPDKPTQ